MATNNSPVDQTLIRRTLLAKAVAARDVRAYSDGLLAEALPPSPDDPADGIDAARRLGHLHKRYKTMAVLTARVCGTSWEDIAERLGVTSDTAEALYGEAEARWRGGDPQPWVAPLSDQARPPRWVSIDFYDADPIRIDGETDAARIRAELDAFTR